MRDVGLLDQIRALFQRERIPEFKTREDYLAWREQHARPSAHPRDPRPTPGSQRPRSSPPKGKDWVLGPAVCPHCSAAFDKFPARKRKCPQCEKAVVIWRDTETRQRTLVTEAEAAELDAERSVRKQAEAEAAAPGKFLRRIRREIACGDLSGAEILQHREKTGSEGDATWALYQVALDREMKKGDFDSLGMLYFSMAHFLDNEQRDFRPLLLEANRCQIRSFQQQERESPGLLRGVEICTGGCDACQRLNGRRFTFGDALRMNPLPCAGCTTRMDSEQAGFCRCCYVAWID